MNYPQFKGFGSPIPKHQENREEFCTLNDGHSGHVNQFRQGSTTTQHLQEWRQSEIADDLTLLNVRSLDGYSPYEYLCYSSKLERTNTGRLASHLLRRYSHTEAGGWWCDGLDPMNNWEPMQWGCFKPDIPHRDDNGKVIKYEHPPKTPTRLFCLRVNQTIWETIAERYQLPMPNYVTVTQDGEAVGFWQWVVENKLPVVLTEGAKKAASLLSAGFVGVALPGITGGYRVEKDGDAVGGCLQHRVVGRHLIPELKPFAGCPIYICFDNDTKPKTVKAVNSAIATFGGLLVRAGSEVHVIRWHHPEKGVDDLIAARGVSEMEIAYSAAISLNGWQVEQHSKLTYPASLTLNQRYLGELPVPSNAKLIGIKAPKGTGKTEALAQIVGEELARQRWVLVLTHRVQLGEALCNRFGVPYVTQVYNTPEGKYFGYGLCVDSLHPKSQARFSAENWTDGTVIIDECEQVFWHLLNSSTLSSDRVPILKEFKQLLTNVLQGDGRVILSDADLSDVSLDYVGDLAGVALTPWICVNSFQPTQAWNVRNYTDNDPSGLVAALEQHIAEGGRPFVCLTGQKVKSKWGTQILEARLRARFPHLPILRIDSESVSDPTHPAYGCIDKLNEVLPKYDIVLASPSIETGVSIDIRGHFTSCWGIFQGVTAENSARQALARLREPVDRHIWCASYGIGKIGNGSTSIKSLLASQHKLAKAHRNLLMDADFDPESIDCNFDSVSLRTWAKMAVRINAGMVNYREAIAEGLRAEGHTVNDAKDRDDDAKDALKEEITQVRDTQQALVAEAICNAPDIPKTQYEKLLISRAKTEAERREQRRYELHNLRYAIEPTPELVMADDDGWFPQIQLHYYLTLGRSYLKPRDKKRAQSQTNKGDGAVWMPDFNKSQLGAKVGVLESLGVLALIEAATNNEKEREYRANDEDLKELAKRAILHRWGIKSALGISIKESHSPIEIIKKLLGKLGLDFQRGVRDGTGDRLWAYRLSGLDNPLIPEIFAAWGDRDALAEAEANKSVTRHSSVNIDLLPTCDVTDQHNTSVTRHSPVNIDLLPSCDVTTCDVTQNPPNTLVEVAQMRRTPWKVGDRCRIVGRGFYTMMIDRILEGGRALLRVANSRWDDGVPLGVSLTELEAST